MTDSRIGLCLDIDGTIYREGSVFLETLLRLPDAPGCSLTRLEQVQLREAIGIVGRYQGGRLTAWRWRAMLRVIDSLRILGADRAAAIVRDRLLALQAWIEQVTADGETPLESSIGYEAMRSALLDQYGTVIAGHEAATLRTGITELLEAITPIDTEIPAVLEHARQAGIDIVLVTDMPVHIADPYAEAIIGPAVQGVIGTRYEIEDEEFTGAFEAGDKQTAVCHLRKQYGWERVIAAGDTRRDLVMQEFADQFVAVSGQGRLREALDEPMVFEGDAPSLADVREATTVYVPPNQPVDEVLQLVLGLT